MDRTFWESRWQANKIGFHEGRPNAYLEEHAARLSGRVLVPLCGKAEDLAFLAGHGHEVIGIELVEDAVRAFFTEHGTTPDITPRGAMVEYRTGSITIFAGDVFASTRELVGAIDSIYDRAALIALPPELRPRYVEHLRALAGEVPGLLVTLEYPQERMPGPPFAVLEAEVRSLYARVELLGERTDAQHPRAAELGLSPTERCFAIAL